MANTGHDWAASWTVIDASVTLTEGATTTDTSDVQTMDIKSSAIVSIDADYSNHAKATGGLFVYILRETGDGSYEDSDTAAISFEMPFAQNSTKRKTFILHGNEFNKWKIYLDWQNSTSSSSVTVQTDVIYSDIPVAS